MLGRHGIKTLQSGRLLFKLFRDTGITLSVDGSGNHKLKIKGFQLGELVVGDWARSEQEAGYGTSEKENSELPAPSSTDHVEFQLQDE